MEIQNEPIVPENTENAPLIEGQGTQPPVETQPVQGGTPAPADFDGNNWQLNFKGQTIIPKDREHLINLAQQGYGYSQGMEQLNVRNREIDEIQTKYKPYEELHNTLQANPQFAKELWELQNRYTQGSDIGEDADPRITQIQTEMADHKQRLDGFLNKQADIDVKSEQNDLRTAFPDEKWDFNDGESTFMEKIVKHALSSGSVPLKMAYHDFNFAQSQINSKADGLKQAQNTRVDQSKQGIVNNAPGGVQPGVPAYTAGETYNTLEEKAIKELGG